MTSFLERLLGLSLFIVYPLLALALVCVVAEAVKAYMAWRGRVAPRKSGTA